MANGEVFWWHSLTWSPSFPTLAFLVDALIFNKKQVLFRQGFLNWLGQRMRWCNCLAREWGVLSRMRSVWAGVTLRDSGYQPMTWLSVQIHPGKSCRLRCLLRTVKNTLHAEYFNAFSSILPTYVPRLCGCSPDALMGFSSKIVVSGAIVKQKWWKASSRTSEPYTRTGLLQRHPSHAKYSVV